MLRRSVVALAVSMLACGGRPPPKPTPAPTAPIAQKPEPKSGALFASVRDALLPIGCYDATKKLWGSGEACAALAPKGTQVAMETGAPRVAIGREPPDVGCDVGPVVRTDGPSLGFAVWPTAVRATVRTLPRQRARRRTTVDPLAADERAKIAAQLKGENAPGNEPIEGIAAFDVDVDGDGKDDRVLVVRLAPMELRARFEFVGAIYLARSSTGRVDLVAADEGADFELRGTLDVDQDGVRELWWASTFVEEQGTSETITEGLSHLVRDRVEIVGEAVTGGAGTCAAEFNDTQ
jgi:hypothetical protein